MYLLELWTNLNREPLRSQTHSFTEIGYASLGTDGGHGCTRAESVTWRGTGTSAAKVGLVLNGPACRPGGNPDLQSLQSCRGTPRCDCCA